MNVINNLLILYAGMLLFNVALSAMLAVRQKMALNRILFFVWTAILLSFVIQGFTQTGSLVIGLGFSSAIVATFAWSHLLSSLVDLPTRRTPFIAGWAVAVVVAILAEWARLPFWMVNLPLAVAVVAPLGWTTVNVLRKRSKQLSTTGKALAATCLVYCVHLLDFPFLRDRPSTVPMGFTVALLITLAFSITASAVVLERFAEGQARMEELNRVKNQFFANISHELRTPMTLIMAPVRILLDNVQLPSDQRGSLQVVQRNASRLLKLIDELLDLSLLDAGGLRLNVSDVDLGSIVSSIYENSVPAAQAKSITLTIDTLTRLTDVHGDAHRLEIVLTNLIGNAIKYTPSGGKIHVRLVDDGERVRVEVTDAGAGIAEKDLPHIFQRFFQVNPHDRRRGGVGIGLALAKELAELHGGGISVKSRLGEGSTFSLWLPKGKEHFRAEVVERRRSIAPVNEPRRVTDMPPRMGTPSFIERGTLRTVSGIPSLMPSAFGPSSARARILVVDDNEELRTLMRQLFEPLFEVIEAANGEEGLAAVRAERPDLVVSDVMMPVRTGIEMCDAIKRDPELRATPVILLTAMGGAETTLGAYAHGANDFVTKPFHPQVLLARVKAQLQIRTMSMQLISQEKLVAIGTLAAGVAHEINNPINAILNAANVLSRKESEKSKMTDTLLAVIVDGAQRILNIVSALGDYARPADSSSMMACNVHEGLDATLRLLDHRMSDVVVHKTCDADQFALAPVGPVNQVFLNLVDNALRSGAKNIWLKTNRVGDRLVVRVIDDGQGVPPDVAKRIFDPFFTTREPGEGAGLGLYISRKMLTECGGELKFEARPTRGAEFQVILPAEVPLAGIAV